MQTCINVLSLFDGVSCAQQALQRLGIKVNKYFASEIEKQPIKVTQHNFSDTIQLGDVTKINVDELPEIDLLIGGSPCQGFSTAGKGFNFNDPRSELFFEYVRIKNELQNLNPNLIWLLENVRMKKKWEGIISQHVGTEPILINSALVSAQNRNRNFWTNINQESYGLFDFKRPAIPQPLDRGILLKHILQPHDEVAEKYYLSQAQINRILRGKYSHPQINPDKTVTINTKNNSGQFSIDNGTTLITESIGVVNDVTGLRQTGDKSLNIDANYHKGMDNHGARTMVMDLIYQLNRSTESGGKQPYQQNRIYGIDGKMPSLCGGAGNAHELTKIYLHDNPIAHNFMPLSIELNGSIRRLTPIEVCRLQTVNDNYFFDSEGKQIVSDSAIYKAMGNGFTVDVIAHILSFANFPVN